MHSEGQGSFWPYIGVDRAVSYLLRGEPEKTLDYFCAFTDTAGGTLSWGEGYSNVTAGGDQPHFWADAQWINLFRHLFVFEDQSDLWITPALFRRWHQAGNGVSASGMTTHFGDLDLQIRPSNDGTVVDYRIRISPKGDQASRNLERIILYPRLPDGRAIQSVTLDDEQCDIVHSRHPDHYATGTRSDVAHPGSSSDEPQVSRMPGRRDGLGIRLKLMGRGHTT